MKLTIRQKRWLGWLVLSVIFCAFFILMVMGDADTLVPWPLSVYTCGNSKPESLPESVKIGIYEEFPTEERLSKLSLLDFPFDLAIASRSRQEHDSMVTDLRDQYPLIGDVYYWPLLSEEAGYYPGPYSEFSAIETSLEGANGLKTILDLEPPTKLTGYHLEDFFETRRYIDSWLRGRQDRVQIWRSTTWLGVNPIIQNILGINYNPKYYPNLTLQLDFYATGQGLSDHHVYNIMRCGVEKYGERFAPSLGMLNDGFGSEDVFVPLDTYERYLKIAREAGVQEVWLFQSSGLNEEYLRILKSVLPVK